MMLIIIEYSLIYQYYYNKIYIELIIIMKLIICMWDFNDLYKIFIIKFEAWLIFKIYI